MYAYLLCGLIDEEELMNSEAYVLGVIICEGLEIDEGLEIGE